MNTKRLRTPVLPSVARITRKPVTSIVPPRNAARERLQTLEMFLEEDIEDFEACEDLEALARFLEGSDVEFEMIARQ